MSATAELYPLLFEPVLKEYIWGGHGLARRLHRPVPADVPIAESWEIAAHPHGVTRATNGVHAGKPLTLLLAEVGEALVGRRAGWALARDRFPLLIKILDAAHRLSVQVHPDDAYAQAHEGNELGKSEMWVVLDAEPEAAVILGLQPGATREQLRAALEEGRPEPLLHRLPVKAGDHLCVPAGSLHAILGGVLIAEIQQNSDTTYRVFDWNRVDKEGRPRPLHVRQALEVINFGQIAPSVSQAQLVRQERDLKQERLCANPYFIVERLTLAAGAQYTGRCDGASLEIWGVIRGGVTITAGPHRLDLQETAFTLLPAALGAFTVTGEIAPAVLLRAYLPEPG